MRRLIIVIRWTFKLGLAGFLLGFFGPMLLSPSANQGPLAGIFVTGPIGALLGFIIGLRKAATAGTPRFDESINLRVDDEFRWRDAA